MFGRQQIVPFLDDRSRQRHFLIMHFCYYPDVNLSISRLTHLCIYLAGKFWNSAMFLSSFINGHSIVTRMKLAEHSIYSRPGHWGKGHGSVLHNFANDVPECFSPLSHWVWEQTLWLTEEHGELNPCWDKPTSNRIPHRLPLQRKKTYGRKIWPVNLDDWQLKMAQQWGREGAWGRSRCFGSQPLAV